MGWGTVSQLEHRAGEVARTEPRGLVAPSHGIQGTCVPAKLPSHGATCYRNTSASPSHFLKSLAMYGVPFSVGRDHCPDKAPFKGVLTGNWTLNLGRRFPDLTLYFCGSEAG